MKIEVCEQLIASWLQHINGCQVVQTNWVPSPLLDIPQEDLDSVDKFIVAVKEFIKDEDIDIFKKSTLKQFLYQCEIDIVGIKVVDGIIGDLYFVDSAFHEAGLNYGDVVARVLKKIYRAILVSSIVFRNIPAHIKFVSPKCGLTLKNTLSERLNAMEYIVNKYYPDMDIELIFNEDFTSKIYLPLVEHVDKISNDNDLFMRSIKLSLLAQSFIQYGNDIPKITHGKSERSKSKLNENDPIPQNQNTTGRKTERGVNKQIVFSTLKALADNGLMTEIRISQLQDRTFTKKTFDIPSFPFLITESNFRNSGFNECRFYGNDRFTHNGIRYRVCSQWIPNRIRALEAWYQGIIAKGE